MNIAEIKNDNERFRAYKNLGYTKEALEDEDYYIRLRAYEALGFTKEALDDEDCEIRQKAYEYFKDHKQQQNIEKEMEYIPTFLQIENDSYRLVNIKYKSSFKKGSINSVEYEKENGDLVVLTQEILKTIYKNKGE